MSNLTPFNSAYGLGQVGPQVLTDGSNAATRMGKQGESIVGDAHARFYEAASRGAIYSGGQTALTSISNATFTVGGLANTTTPIIGVWNPATSPVNLVIIQALLTIVVTALTNTGCGGFTWCTSTGNTGLTLGVAPFNQKTFVAAGSSAKDQSTVALTGLTNTPVARRASALNGGSMMNTSQVDTAVGFSPATFSSVENLDGSLIVPPGGLLILVCNTTPVAHSAISGLVWEEVAA